MKPITNVHMEWGAHAIDVFEDWAEVVVVIDVLSFSAAVDVAISRGAIVVPCALDQKAGSDSAMNLVPMWPYRAGSCRRLGPIRFHLSH